VISALVALDAAAGRARESGRPESRPVRVGLVRYHRRYQFAHETIAAFRIAEPETAIALTQDASPALWSALCERKLDMTLLSQRQPPAEGVEERLIHTEGFVLAAHQSHRLARPEPVSIAALAGVPMVWLSLRRQPGYHASLAEAFRAHGVEPLTAHLAPSIAEQMDLTVASGGVSIMPASTLGASRGTIVYRPIVDLDLRIPLSLAWRTDLKGAAAHLLADLQAAADRHQAAVAEGAIGWARLYGHPLVELPK
jgi:hypothetical protein